MRLHEAAPKLIIQERVRDKVKVSSYWPVPELTRAELALGRLQPSKLPNPFAPFTCSPAAPHCPLQACEQAHYRRHHYRRRLAHGGRHGRWMVIWGCTHHTSLTGVCWNQARAACYSATFSTVH